MAGAVLVPVAVEICDLLLVLGGRSGSYTYLCTLTEL